MLLSRAPLLVALMSVVPACSTSVESVGGSSEGGDGGGGTTSMPPPKPESHGAKCGLGHARDAVLVAARGSDLVFVRDDGTSFVAASFPTTGGADGPSIQLSVAGGFVGAIGFTWGGAGAHGRAVLLDSSGHVLFSKDDSHASIDSVFVSKRGDAVFGDSSAGHTLVVHADGSHQSVDGVAPLGPPDANGLFPAEMAPIQDVGSYGWAQAGQAMRFLQYPGDSSFPVLAGDELVYVGEEDGSAVLVRETNDAPPATFPFDAEASVNDASAAGWVTLNTANSGSGFVAAPGAGAKKVKLPSGFATFGMATYRGMRLGSDAGEVLFIGRDEAHGGLFSTRDAGATWNEIGPSFAKIKSLAASSRGGTYVVAASNEAGYFETKPWSDPSSSADAPDHLGAAVFVVRPSDNVTRRLHLTADLEPSISLDEEGLCAAFVGADGGLRAHDVKTGREKVVVRGAADGSGANAFAWLR